MAKGTLFEENGIGNRYSIHFLPYSIDQTSGQPINLESNFTLTTEIMLIVNIGANRYWISLSLLSQKKEFLSNFSGFIPRTPTLSLFSLSN